jgi:hypothetical protein
MIHFQLLENCHRTKFVKRQKSGLMLIFFCHIKMDNYYSDHLFE